MQQMLRHELAILLECRLEIGVGQRGPGVGSADGENPVHEAKLKRAAVPDAGDARIRDGIDRNHAAQVRRPGTGKGMLRAAYIAGPKRADLAVAPGLFADPLEKVIAVVGIIEKHSPSALGSIPAT